MWVYLFDMLLHVFVDASDARQQSAECSKMIEDDDFSLSMFMIAKENKINKKRLAQSQASMFLTMHSSSVLFFSEPTT